MIKHGVKVHLHATEVGFEVRCVGVPAGPDRALVVRQSWHRDQSPLRTVKLLVIGGFEVRDTHQCSRSTVELAVDSEAPAVVGAREDAGISFIVAAYLHATVPAGIEENVDPALAVPREDHRFSAHA